MPSDELRGLFPKLRGNSFKINSPQDPRYNCIAFAASDSTRWWSPSPDAFWPEDVPPENVLDAWVLVFNKLGYHRCDNAHLEPGFEKIAIYGLAHIGAAIKPTHVARQTRSGRWVSKVGKLEDIVHKSLEVLEGDRYGDVVLILKRPMSHRRRR